jgi:hypothetical protein
MSCYCVISVRDFRTLYVGPDAAAAYRANVEGSYLAEASGPFEVGEAERRAAIAAGYINRGLAPPTFIGPKTTLQQTENSVRRHRPNRERRTRTA